MTQSPFTNHGNTISNKVSSHTITAYLAGEKRFNWAARVRAPARTPENVAALWAGARALLNLRPGIYLGVV